MSKVITMSEETASKLMSDLLDVFGIVMSFWPIIRVTESILNPQRGTKYWRYELNSKLSIEKIKKDFVEKGKKIRYTSKNAEDFFAILAMNSGKVSNEEFIETDVLTATFKNRKFEITIYDDPDCVGFCSITPDYDPETYLCSIISELREDGSKKCSMTFGFDIEKMQFLELFELQYTNQVGIIRKLEDIDELEEKFYAKDFLQIQIEGY